MKYQTIKGTRDILPPETCEWQKIENSSRDVFRAFGYSEIRTPIIEETALFVKSVGEDTDIVKKEMFSFVDRGERNISLRPEGTAPIIRAYLENNLYKTQPFQKLYYMGPMFRAERPQAGRMRQFSQIGLEAIGSGNPALDAEVIAVMKSLLDGYGIKDYEIRLNNLGCREDKKKLSKILKDTLSDKVVSGKLCEDCKRRSATNPLRTLDCKNENCRAIIRGRFTELDFLCASCKDHFSECLRSLDALKIKYTVDPYIVRGLDYYTRTVFEVTCGQLGAQNAVGAGGRYDDLIGDMGGPSLGACGFALGVDRVILAMGKGELEKCTPDALDVFIAALGKSAFDKAFAILSELRTAGIACDIDYEAKSLKAQMRSADGKRAKFVFIIGDDEIAKGEAVLRNMQSKEQVSVKFSDIVNTIKSKIG